MGLSTSRHSSNTHLVIFRYVVETLKLIVHLQLPRSPRTVCPTILHQILLANCHGNVHQCRSGLPHSQGQCREVDCHLGRHHLDLTSPDGYCRDAGELLACSVLGAIVMPSQSMGQVLSLWHVLIKEIIQLTR